MQDQTQADAAHNAYLARIAAERAAEDAEKAKVNSYMMAIAGELCALLPSLATATPKTYVDRDGETYLGKVFATVREFRDDRDTLHNIGLHMRFDSYRKKIEVSATGCRDFLPWEDGGRLSQPSTTIDSTRATDNAAEIKKAAKGIATRLQKGQFDRVIALGLTGAEALDARKAARQDSKGEFIAACLPVDVRESGHEKDALDVRGIDHRVKASAAYNGGIRLEFDGTLTAAEAACVVKLIASFTGK